MKKQRRLSFNLWERIDFLTGKKFVVCNHQDDIKMLRPYFPIGTKIVSKASGPRGAYYIMDMEALKKKAAKLAPDFIMPKPEPKKWNDAPKLYDGRERLNVVIHVEERDRQQS